MLINCVDLVSILRCSAALELDFLVGCFLFLIYSEGSGKTSFLLNVKNRVEATEGRRNKRRRLDALTRQEMRFDSGAVLSDSGDSQGTADSESSIESFRSDRAVVSASFNPHRAQEARRKKLKEEGHSEHYIKIELAMHDRPNEVKAQHRQRRDKLNKYIVKKKTEFEKARKGIQKGKKNCLSR